MGQIECDESEGSPRMSSNSCALPRAKTGMRQRPPLVTVSWIVAGERVEEHHTILALISL